MAFPDNMASGSYSSIECQIYAVTSLRHSNISSGCNLTEVFKLTSGYSSDCGYASILITSCIPFALSIDQLPEIMTPRGRRLYLRAMYKKGKENKQYDYLNGVKLHIRG